MCQRAERPPRSLRLRGSNCGSGAPGLTAKFLPMAGRDSDLKGLMYRSAAGLAIGVLSR